MSKQEKYIMKGKCLISISIAFILVTVGLTILPTQQKEDKYEISYEYVNIKDMATAKIAEKKDTTSILEDLINHNNTTEKLQEIPLTSKENTTQQKENKKIWYLPVENGTITTTSNPYHMALDITSTTGSNTNIFPIADGTISGMYTDGAGAKIITIRHNIDGMNYTSQYVHLSTYATGLYIGKEVTINDCIGKMGSTGNTTGVHLHLALIDCSLFDPNDLNCKDINSFFKYSKQRYYQGFYGLESIMDVPQTWINR